jgi:DNA/RNA-binding domain of Phe-tRNA-synthetase-like protein
MCYHSRSLHCFAIAERSFRMQFIVEDDFWAMFPGALIGVVVAQGFDNTQAGLAAITALLEDAALHAATALAGVEIAAHVAVAPWRRAYQAFGVKPSKYRSSIESLLRSAQAGRVRRINPLVDLYNTVSLRHLLPCGGEDLAMIEGDMRLTRARGDELFVPLGASQPEPPQPGEIIYRDDAGVICRCWNWREADRTKLTESTTGAVLCIEALPEMGAARLSAACADLAQLVREYLGGETIVELLDRSRPALQVAP